MQSLFSQLFAFLVTICGGILFGLTFDIYRVARGIIRPKKIITHLGDLVFWILSTILIFLILLLGNWGEVRSYVFIGLFLGALMYLKLFSSRVIKFILVLVKTVKTLKLKTVQAFRFLYKVISYPVSLTQRIVLIPVGFLGGFLIYIKSAIKKILTRLRMNFKKSPPPE